MSDETMPTTTTGTSTPTIAELAARLAGVERSARRWRTAAVVAVLAVVGMGAADAVKVPDEIKAKAFTVVSADGREGVGKFFMLDADGANHGCILLGSTDSNKATVINAGGLPAVIGK
jgi:hypothetical protein